MGVIEQQQEEIQELRQEVRQLREFMEVYFEKMDHEVKGHEAAARFIGVSRSTLKTLVKAKKIAYKKDGRSISFSRKDLVEYKQKRRLGKRPAATHQHII